MSSRQSVLLPLAVLLALAFGLVGVRTERPAQAAFQDAPAKYPPPERPSPPNRGSLGLILATNTPGWATVLPSSRAPGVLVLGVVPGYSAAESVRVGSLIVAVDNVPVSNEEQMKAFLKGRGGTTFGIRFVDTRDVVRNVSVEMESEAPSPTRLLDYLNKRADGGDLVAKVLIAQSSSSADVGLTRTRALIGDMPTFAELRALEARFVLQALARTVGAPPLMDADISAADAALSRATELDPESPSVRLVAAEAMLAFGRPDVAEQQAMNALGLDPESPKAHELLGSARLALGRPADALPDLRRGVELNPYEPAYYRALISGYTELKRPRDAAATERALDGLLASTNTALRAKFVSTRKAVAAVLAFGMVVGLAERSFARRRHPEDRSSSRSRRPVSTYRTGATEALVFTGILAAVAPYLGPGSGLVEFYVGGPALLAHLLPGLVVAVAGIALLRDEGSRLRVIPPAPGTRVTFGIYTVLGLAGVWLCGAHLGLFLDALRDDVPWSAFLWYSVAGPVSLALIGWLYVTERSDRDVPGHSGREEPLAHTPSAAS